MDHLASLRIFARVVELGSFSKAAESLQVSQSTVTKNVARLEAHVGARLVNRNTRGAHPSELGFVYYEKCKAILELVDASDDLIRSQDAGLEGSLRLATSIALGEAVVGPMLVPFMRAHPRLRVELSCEDSYVDLIARGIDIALRMGRLDDSTLGVRPLGVNPWVMVAAPSYLGRRGAPASPADLVMHDCLVYSSVHGDAVWRLRAEAGEAEARAVSGVFRSNNLPALLAAARSGLGIAILPRYVAEAAIGRGELVPLMPDHSLPEQTLYAVFPSPRLVPRKVRALVDHLSRCFSGEWWAAGR